MLRRLYTVRIYWRRRMLWKILGLFRFNLVVDTMQGKFSIPTDRHDYISKNLFINRGFELDLARRAIAFCHEYSAIPKGKGIMIDIGANNGVISMGMLKENEVDRVICIEPEPVNFKRLEKNIQLNDCQERSEAIHCAISNTNEPLIMELSSYDKGDHRIRKESLTDKTVNRELERKTISVPSKTLDQLIIEKEINTSQIKVLWLDTQGHEGYIFKGGKKTFSLGIPVVCELSPYLILRSGMRLEEYVDVISDLFENVWHFDGNEFRKYDISHTLNIMNELGVEGPFDDVIYT